MSDKLDLITALVATNYPFIASKYPSLIGADADAQKKFEVSHSALHFAKTAGQLATVSEAADHGAGINNARLAELAAKGLINAVKLAEVAGMDASALLAAVEQEFNKQQSAA